MAEIILEVNKVQTNLSEKYSPKLIAATSVTANQIFADDNIIKINFNGYVVTITMSKTNINVTVGKTGTNLKVSKSGYEYEISEVSEDYVDAIECYLTLIQNESNILDDLLEIYINENQTSSDKIDSLLKGIINDPTHAEDLINEFYGLSQDEQQTPNNSSDPGQ